MISKILSLTLVLGCFLQTAWGQSSAPKELPLDANLPRFEKTKQGQEYLKKHRRLPHFRDSKGYPIPKVRGFKKEKSLYQRKYPTRPGPTTRPAPKIIPKTYNPNVKTTFLDRVFSLFISSAHAYDYEYDANGDYTGVLNCRSTNYDYDPSFNPGYFKAYFPELIYDQNGNLNLTPNPSGFPSGSGTSFGNSIHGSLWRDIVCEVFEDIAGIINLDTHGGAKPRITVQGIGYPGALGVAIPYTIPQSREGANSGFLREYIISRVSSFETQGMIGINLENFAWNTQNLPSGPFQGTTVDLRSVLRHEMLHLLGFYSALPAVVGQQQQGTHLHHSHFDKFINHDAGTNWFFPALSDDLNNLFGWNWGAPPPYYVNNMAFYRGKRNSPGAQFEPSRPLYSPTEYTSGSSLSHFDMNRPPVSGSIRYLMHPSLGEGEVRSIHEHEKEVLCHLGYQVDGISGCNVPSPVSNLDLGTLTSTSICINFLSNDYSIVTNNSDSLSLQTLQPIAPSSVASGITYHYDTNCGVLTPAVTSLANAQSPVKSIRVTTPTTMLSFHLKYNVRDSLTNRVSDATSIIYTRCTAPANEFVCNGTFEQGSPQVNPYDYTGSMISTGQVPFWRSGMCAPRLVVHRIDGDSDYYSDPTYGEILPARKYDNNFNPSILIRSFPQSNSTYGALLESADLGDMWTGQIPHAHILATKLKAPLTPGQCYKLTFQTAHYINQAGLSGPFDVRLSTWDMSVGDHTDAGAPASDTVNPNLSSGHLVYSQQLSSQTPLVSVPSPHPFANFPMLSETTSMIPWQQHTQYFRPGVAYSHMALGPRPGVNNFLVWTDDVSLTSVDSSMCPNHSISGVVYQDLDASGSISPGEPATANVTLGLFNPQTGALAAPPTMSDPITGIYTFFGVSPAQSYVVAMMPENQVQTITEPVANFNVLNNTQYPRVVAFGNGGVVTGQNFGILLNGQNPTAPPTLTSSGCTNVTLTATAPSLISGPFTYSWSGPSGFTSSLQSPVVTVPGTYSVTVSNSTGYQRSASLGVQMPAPTSVVGSVIQATSGNNGAINLTSVTGTSPFTYLWSNGATTQNLSNMAPGTYSVTVRNANNCPTTQSFIVLSQMQASVNRKQGCSQADNAVIAGVTGGVAPYTYRWFRITGSTELLVHQATSSNISLGYANATAGVYIVRISDSSGQQFQSAQITIDAYTAPTIAMLKADATAPTFTNGQITVTVSGGVGPFNYAFTGPNPLTVNAQPSPYTRLGITGSNTNVYGVSVTDFRGCQSNTIGNIKVLRKLNEATTSVVRRCEGTVVSARVNITPPTGGHGPYNYAVNGVALPAGQTFFNATANSSLTITDSSTPTPQTFTHPVTVTPIPPAHTVSVAVVNATNGQANGSATVTTTAGLGPYTYTFTPGTASSSPNNSFTRSNLAAGSYSVQVRTGFGCTSSSTFKILQNTTTTTTPR